MSKGDIEFLVERLIKKGKEIPEDIKASINGIGFRLLEQLRLGNRDDVFYMLLRCFKAKEKEFPNELIEVFKPENEAYFKTLLFSFLASVFGKETKGGEA